MNVIIIFINNIFLYKFIIVIISKKYMLEKYNFSYTVLTFHNKNIRTVGLFKIEIKLITSSNPNLIHTLNPESITPNLHINVVYSYYVNLKSLF